MCLYYAARNKDLHMHMLTEIDSKVGDEREFCTTPHDIVI